MSKVTEPPLSFAAYERLFQAIYGVVSGHCQTPEKACFYFAFIGANLIWRSHRLPAMPVAGAAGYRVGARDWVVFGAIREGKVCSSLEVFHCWIEIGGWVVDLSAPLLGRLTGSAMNSSRPAMFQARARPLWTEQEIDGRRRSFHTPNAALTAALTALLLKDAAFISLAIASEQALLRPHSRLGDSSAVNDIGPPI